jgi:hypothetical protein
VKKQIEVRARELNGSAVYQGKTKTFFISGNGVITRLKNEFTRFGFKFEKR